VISDRNFGHDGTNRQVGASTSVAVVNKQETPMELVNDDDVAPVALDFESFFAAHRRPVASALALTLHDNDLATDATAEAMARAFQRWDDVSLYANPAGWVYRVGLNWARSRRRKLFREVFSSESPDQPAAAAPDIDLRLDGALRALPVEQRSVVVLRYLLDWSEFQTAEALQIAPGTVKSRLSRALGRLSVALEDPDES